MRQEPIVIYINMWAEINDLHDVFHKLYFQSELPENDKLKLLEMLKQGFLTMLICLDLTLREFIVQEMGNIFVGKKQQTKGFKRFKFTGETLLKIKEEKDEEVAREIFEEAVRDSLSRDQKLTFWSLEDIEDGFKLIGDKKYIDIVAYKCTNPDDKKRYQDLVRSKLNEMKSRRDKIAHSALLGDDSNKISWDYFYTCFISIPDLIVNVHEYYKSQENAAV